MKLLLISLNQQDVEECKKAPTDISALGTRYLSSYLKSKGHKVNILFLAKPHSQEENEKELKQINDLISKLAPDLIGISLMSNHFFRARKIAVSIKNKFDMPIIWGGIHPTIEPVSCLNYADMVCVGEGEVALEQLLSRGGMIEPNIQGIWHKKNKQIIDKGFAPLLENIDDIPYPDYNLTDHYIIHNHQLIPLTVEIFRQYYPASRGDHRLISSRGCPHACAYCCNSVFRLMYSGRYFRKRSVNGLINEMATIINQFPFIKSFKIMDDNFTANDINWLKQFGRQYKEKINLPWFCLVSPLTIDEEKLETLINCGLKTIQMGLQSGSDRVNKETYSRNIKSSQFLTAAKLLETYSDKLEVIIDVIIDNPFETGKDLIETIGVLNQLKRPFNLALYSLAFYPGTELFKRAVKENILNNTKEYLSKEFHLFRGSYLNKLIYLIPRLKKEKIDKLVNERQNLFIKFYVGLLFLIYTKKNKLPSWVLKILSKLKKTFKKH